MNQLSAQQQSISVDDYIKKLHEKIGELTMQVQIQADLIRNLKQQPEIKKDGEE